jgi:hypothetical protein
MQSIRTRRVPAGVFAVVLAAAGVLAACGGGVEGRYQDPTGTITAEFQDGKAYLGFGADGEHGQYKIQGDKIIVTGNLGPLMPSPLVFTINRDGSIDGPNNAFIPRLRKVK